MEKRLVVIRGLILLDGTVYKMCEPEYCSRVEVAGRCLTLTVVDSDDSQRRVPRSTWRFFFNITVIFQPA